MLTIRFLEFSVVGAIGVIVNQTVLFLLAYVLGIYYLLAAVFSFEVALLNNFFLNEWWTFRKRNLSSSFWLRLVRFHVSRVLGFAATMVTLFLITEFLNVHYLISNVIAIGIGTCINYFTSDLWVWR
ncbi:MAG: GtrA family protein [Nitrososphaerota archaeon]